MQCGRKQQQENTRAVIPTPKEGTKKKEEGEEGMANMVWNNVRVLQGIGRMGGKKES